jgi:20S proteasome subunit beta 7
VFTFFSLAFARTEESLLDDGHELATSQVYEYLSNVMYSKRSKFDPFWNAILVAGVEDGVPYVSPSHLFFQQAYLSLRSFLSYVDLVGVTYTSPSIATGFGMHLAQPLLRKALDDLGPDGEKLLEEKDARKILENAMKVLFYRDARSMNKVRFCVYFLPSFLPRLCRPETHAQLGAVPNRDCSSRRC